MFAKKLQTKSPVVVLVGRTNVGKSTLFNCLTEKKHAIVSDIPGTTRDVNVGSVDWRRKTISLVDTGGFLDLNFLANKKQTATTIDEKVQKQARDFLTRADLILFVVDNKDGLLPADKQMSGILKKILPEKDKVILVANKVDAQKEATNASNFWQLDWGEPQTVSSVTGANTGDLLDLIIKKLTKRQAFKESIATEEPEATTELTDKPLITKDEIKVCILGKPNVGKSSLLNAILGYDRVIVSPIAHTTREPQDTVINYRGHNIKLIDTAGINRKWKDAKGLEKLGIAKSLEVLAGAEIALLVVDINEPLTKQETKLVEEIFAHRKSLVILANK
ncbi:MAG: ribosome biogenesis GTPase Der, partial [Patescibacteria group bacterium]|nr:ribosome biogenesis GTPase Der [Patescibacteria group bacterium]